MASSKETWTGVISAISAATGRKAYALDARNHGDSDWSEDFDYQIMQDDLHEFMDGIQAKKAVLVGHSMGGKTVMAFARNMPERVEMLVVEDISPKTLAPNMLKRVQTYLQLLGYAADHIPAEVRDLDQAKNFVQEFVEANIPEHLRSTRHGSIDGSTLPLRQDENGKFSWKTNLQGIERKFLDEPSKIPPRVNGVYRGPVLMLYGTRSPYRVSEDTEYIRQLFPVARFSPVEGAGHQIHLEYREEFIKEVVEFVTSFEAKT